MKRYGLFFAVAIPRPGVPQPVRHRRANPSDHYRATLTIAGSTGASTSGTAPFSWRKELNEAGGVLGRPLELVYYDVFADDRKTPSRRPGGLSTRIR